MRQASSGRNVCQTYVKIMLNGLIMAERNYVSGLLTSREASYIIAEPAMSNGQGREAIDTVSFLAAELGLPIDTSWYVCSAT